METARSSLKHQSQYKNKTFQKFGGLTKNKLSTGKLMKITQPKSTKLLWSDLEKTKQLDKWIIQAHEAALSKLDSALQQQIIFCQLFLDNILNFSSQSPVKKT